MFARGARGPITGVALALTLGLLTCNSGEDSPVRFATTSSPFTAAPAAVGESRFSHTDLTRDLIAITGDQGLFSEGHRDRRLKRGDIRKAAFVHGSHGVGIRVAFRYPFPPAPRRSTFEVRALIKTPVRRRDIEVDLTFNTAGEHTRVLTMHPYGSPRPCDVGHRFVASDETVELRVPRSCIGDPPWVRLGLVCISWLHDRADTVAFDDALRSGFRQRGTFSPKLVPSA